MPRPEPGHARHVSAQTSQKEQKPQKSHPSPACRLANYNNVVRDFWRTPAPQGSSRRDRRSRQPLAGARCSTTYPAHPGGRAARAPGEGESQDLRRTRPGVSTTARWRSLLDHLPRPPRWSSRPSPRARARVETSDPPTGGLDSRSLALAARPPTPPTQVVEPPEPPGEDESRDLRRTRPEVSTTARWRSLLDHLPRPPRWSSRPSPRARARVETSDVRDRRSRQPLAGARCSTTFDNRSLALAARPPAEGGQWWSASTGTAEEVVVGCEASPCRSKTCPLARPPR